MGAKERRELVRFHLPHDAVSQPREQLGKTQAHHSTGSDDVPWQHARIGPSQMQNQRGSRPILTAIPRCAVTLFKLGTEYKRILVQHHLEATPPQLDQQLLIQQDVVWIARDPQPR